MSADQKKPASTDPLLEILANLKIAVAQIRLYPKESPQVLKVGMTAYQSVVSFLNEKGKLQLTRTPRGLLINGRRLPVTGELADNLEKTMLDLLLEARVKTISFRKGLSIDELIAFLHALTRKFWDVKEGKDINNRLREQRVMSVTVDEVEYVAVGDGDLVIEDAASKLEGGKARVAELMRTFDQMIEAAVDDDVASEMRLQIMKKLLEQDPTLLYKAQQEMHGKGGGGDAPGWISFEQAQQSLGEIARMMKAADPDTREALRRLGQVLVGGFRHDAAISALMKKFLKSVASDLIPSWMREGTEVRAASSKGPGAEDRVKTILSLEEDEQVHALAQEAEGLVKELSAAGRNDLVEEMLTHLAGFIRDRSDARRVAACDALARMAAGLESSASDELFQVVERRTRTALRGEKDPNVYPKVAELAVSLIDSRFRKGQLEEGRGLLDLIVKQYRVKEAGFGARMELAYRALERVASGGGFEVVLEKLRAEDESAKGVIEALDVAATRALIEEIKKTDNAVKRVRLSELLARTGRSAGALLVDEVQKAYDPQEAASLIEALPHAVDASVAEMALSGALQHSAVPVRRKAAAMLAEQGYARSGTILRDALREEKEKAVRMALIDGLGRLREPHAVAQLCEIAEARSEEDGVRIAACLTLGRIGSANAIPTLAKVCVPGAISKLMSSVPAGVRAAAARALGGFYTDETAREALQKARRDADAGVRTAATDALHAPLRKAFGDLMREVQTVTAVEEVKTGNWKLAGTLEEIPLDQLCQLVANSRKSGALMLDFSGKPGRVFFDEGSVVAAEFGNQQDQKAFDFMYPLKEGYFLFQPGEAPPKTRIRKQVTEMLLNAARLADENATRQL